MQNLNFVALPVPDTKNWAVPGYADAPFSLKIFNGLLFGWTLWIYWPNLKWVAFPVPEIIGGTRKMGSPRIRPRSLFPKILNGLLFGWTLWICWPNLKSVPFPVPEIIGGTRKITAVPGYAHASFSPKLFSGFWSDGPCYCCGQIWSS